jgi:hypothetical protein
MTGIGHSEAMRDMEDDFGIIPQPKINEYQADYISTNYGSVYFSILKSAKDTEMSSIVLEALNFESWKSVTPVYYDKVIRNRNIRDEDSGEMIELVMDKIYFDFAFINGSTLNGVADRVFEVYLSGTNKYVSTMESSLKATLASYDKLVGIYNEAK